MYSAPDDLRLLLAEKELVQLAADGRPGRWADDQTQAVLAEAIDQADSEIDGYISLRVTLPLTFPPRLISNLSAKIAVYNLLRRRASIPDHWRGEYDRCLALLKDIAAGKLPLPDDGADGTDDGDADPGSIAVVTSPPWDGLG